MIDLMAGLAGIFLLVAVIYIAKQADAHKHEIDYLKVLGVKSAAETIRREVKSLREDLEKEQSKQGEQALPSVELPSVTMCEGDPCVPLSYAFGGYGTICRVDARHKNDERFYGTLRAFLAVACKHDGRQGLRLRVTFEGHTDEVPPGKSAECGLKESVGAACWASEGHGCCRESFRANLTVSARRAEEVFSFLREKLDENKDWDLLSCLERHVTISGRSWLDPIGGKREESKQCRDVMFKGAPSLDERSRIIESMKVEHDRRVTMRFSLEAR
jgi:hypothetical protein